MTLRLVLKLVHLALVVHHRAPSSVQSPRLSCRARGAREAVVAAQEVLIEEGGIVPSNTKSPCRAGRAASPSTTCGSLVDWTASLHSSPMPPPPSAALALLAMTGTTNCSASAETPSESIDIECSRARDRLRLARASKGRTRRPGAARRMMIDAQRTWEGPRSAKRPKRTIRFEVRQPLSPSA